MLGHKRYLSKTNIYSSLFYQRGLLGLGTNVFVHKSSPAGPEITPSLLTSESAKWEGPITNRPDKVVEQHQGGGSELLKCQYQYL